MASGSSAKRLEENNFVSFDIPSGKTTTTGPLVQGESEYVVDYSDTRDFVIAEDFSRSNGAYTNKYNLISTLDGANSFPLFSYVYELADPSVVFRFSRDGSLLAAGADDNLIRVWNIAPKEIAVYCVA